MKTFRAERRRSIRYRVLGRRTGAYMPCNQSNWVISRRTV